MSLETKELLKLMKISAKADKTSPVAYSHGEESFTFNEVNEVVRQELQALAGTHSDFRRNKSMIFDLLEQTIDEVLPKKVMEQYGQFADVQTFSQGDKPIFKVRISEASKRRAKQFVTKVGLAGVYEVFKLDGYAVEVQTMAYGGAAQIGLEEFLDGRIAMSDVLDIIMMALDESVYIEIQKALMASIENLGTANVAAIAGFDEEEMDELVAIADSYGPSSIYCTYEFAATMVPDTGWISDEMRNTKWNLGYLANYKGHRVIILPQSYTDETNSQKVIDPGFAWIIPAGANNPVKVAFEGQTLVRDEDNQDWSKEIQVYKKLGVATLITNNICSYENTNLSFA